MSKPTYDELMAGNTAVRVRDFVARVWSGKNKDGSDFVVFPENEEVVALASEVDTAAGRTSELIVNRYGRAALIYVDVTVGNEADISELHLDARVNNVWVSLTGNLLGGTLSEVGVTTYLVSPVAGEGTAQARIPRRYRIRVVSNSNDGGGRDITYSVTVVHLL